MKKWVMRGLGLLVMLVVSACGTPAGGSGGGSSSASLASESTASASGQVNVITREEGSGTRDAFTEIVGLKGDKGDSTTSSAIIQNGTDQVLAYVGQDPKAIGYISLGSLNDTVKALTVNGVDPEEKTVADGSYPLARPFNVITNKDKPLSNVAKDFLAYILTKQGQDIILKAGYVPLKADKEYHSQQLSGQINIAGSTSVGPVMEKLAEAYKKENPNVTINITQNGSSAGIQAATEGSSDLGMASRALHKDETGVEATVIAHDGIAVIVNKANPLKKVTTDQLKQIYLGELSDWADVSE